MLVSAPKPIGAATSDTWLRWLLPLLLIVLSVLLVGTHYESNDDMLLTYIISDYESLRHLSILNQTYVFWIGLSDILSRLYHAAPQVPWYGLTLYAGFYLAVVLSFGLLLRTVLAAASSRVKALTLTGFFFFFFVEHLLFFNFTRVAMLLGGVAVLRVIYDLEYFRARPARLLLPLLALALGLSVRYSSVTLALLMAGIPALALAWRLDGSGGRLVVRGAVVMGVIALTTLGSLVYGAGYKGLVLDPPTLYTKFTTVFDYHNFFFRDDLPPADKWRAVGVEQWVCGDGEAFDAGFFERTGKYDMGRYARETVPLRISEFINVNLNYLGQWLLLAALVWWLSRTAPTKRAWWLVLGSAAYFLGLLGAMMLLKLPHRIISPAITMAALALLPMAPSLPAADPAFWRRRGVLVVLVLAGLFHTGRTAVRSIKYHRLRTENETYLATYNDRYRGRLVVQGRPGLLYFYLNPLKSYELHSVRRVPTDSWTTAFAWFAEHCRQTTGAGTWAGAMQAAAREPDARWLMSASFADFMTNYLRYVHNLELTLELTDPDPIAPATKLREYRATIRPLATPPTAAALRP